MFAEIFREKNDGIYFSFFVSFVVLGFAEYPRRSSVSRENVVVTLRDCDDKENGKMSQVRSPMGSKGAIKNFMSPTISAASKINPSPRKKILEERNEPVRTSSVSLSDFKISSFSPTISDFSSDHKKEEEEILAAPLASADSTKAKSDSARKKVAFMEPPEVVELEPTFKISPPPPPPPPSSSSSIPMIVPLDSDPLARPYDPKTNYLSPRPRFLHYKPNPRVELYLNMAKEGKRLDDSFAFGSFSDSDTTEEKEEAHSAFLPKESEDEVSSREEVRAEEKKGEEEEEVEEEELFVSEPRPIDYVKPEEEELVVSEPSPIDHVISEDTVEAKRELLPRSFWRSKLTALLIVLSIVCVSISVANLPVIDHSVFDGTPAFLKPHDQSEVVEFAKASFDGMTQRFHVWYENSISSLSELISNLRGAHKVEPLHYFNLTDLVEDYVPFDGYEITVFVPTREKGEFPIGAAEIIVEDKALQIDSEYDDEQVHQEADEASSEVEEMPEAYISPDSEEVGKEESKISVDFEDDRVPLLSADEAKSEVSEAGLSKDEVDVGPGIEMEAAKDKSLRSENPEVDACSEGVKSSEKVDFTFEGSPEEDSFSKVNMLGIALLVLALIASAGFVFVKKGNKSSTLKNASDVIKIQGLVTKKLHSIEPENTLEVRPSSWECSGESCPSEMSNYQNTPSYNNKKGLNSLNEAQSYERKTRKNQRRESMASSMDSSMGSQSYGSFTTFEKIPTKFVSLTTNHLFSSLT